MTFAQLSVVCLVGLLGPLLALPKRWHLPVVLGELIAGIVIGRTGFGYVDTTDPVFTFLANLGFALVMFIAGTHVPVRDPTLRPALRAGVLRAVAVGVLSAAGGWALAAATGVHHGAMFAVLLASSSAALVLPIVDSLRLGGPKVVALLPQVAVADAACIVALPLAIDPAHAWRAAGGALAVIAASAVLFVLLRRFDANGLWHRVHDTSQHRLLALELRIQLVILFALAAVATTTHVSIMLAGFAFGLAVAGVGEPRRLAKQLFGLGEGFLAPVFFVWLGASLDLRAFGSHPGMIGVGVLLGLGAVLTHLVAVLRGVPLSLALLSSAQLGVPVAAATIGTQSGLLRPGEASALMLGALVTIAAAVAGGGLAVRSGLVEEATR